MNSAMTAASCLGLLFLGSTVLAQPVVTAVAGDASHGATLHVAGSALGTKSPAAPLAWDDGTRVRPLDELYTETLPSAAQQGAEYNMQYRSLPFRTVLAPHSRITHALAGAHATDDYAGQYLSGNNVSLVVPLTSFQFFAQYWYHIDPSYDEANHPTLGENLKELCLTGAPDEVYGGEWGYFGVCGNRVPDINYDGPIRISRLGVDCPDLPYACSDDAYAVTHLSPKHDWVKMQWEGGYDSTYDNPTVRFTTYPDGAVTETDHYGNAITTFETIYGCGFPPSDGLRGLGIGGFSRVPRTNNGTNSFRYFTGIYVDDTPARVMLGDDADYDACTVMEPQIPSSWSDTAITVTANLGALPDTGTAYLFVFDDNGQRSSPGFPVELGGELPPACADGQDNDDDGLVDYPDDPGCSSADDNDETDGGGSGGAGTGGGASGGAAHGPAADAAGGDDGGCGCRVGPSPSSPQRARGLWLLAAALLLARRRRAS